MGAEELYNVDLESL